MVKNALKNQTDRRVKPNKNKLSVKKESSFLTLFSIIKFSMKIRGDYRVRWKEKQWVQLGLKFKYGHVNRMLPGDTSAVSPKKSLQQARQALKTDEKSR